MVGRMEMDALAGDSPCEGMLVFYETLPTLQHLATLKAAAEIISLKMIPDVVNLRHFMDELKVVFKWGEERLNWRWKFTEHLPIPHHFQFEISELLKPMISEICRWIFHHLDYISGLVARLPSEFLSDFVWKKDASIDYVLTAEKLIYGGKLDEQERFKMMCAYCLEYDLEDMFDTSEWLRDCLVDEEFDGSKLILYWQCRLTGHETAISDDTRSNERYMIESYEAFNLMAIDFYFCQMNEEELNDFCIGKMMRFHSLDVKFLLMRLTVEQQRNVLELKTLDIMKIFVKDSYPEFALQLWNHVKDSISGEQYVEMMRTTMLRIGKKVKFDDLSGYPDWLEDLTMDIWKTTPRCLKQFVFQNQNGSFIFEWDRWFGTDRIECSSDYLRNDSLLLEILSDADSEFKKQFWMKEWTRLMIGSRPEFLRRFMFICMRDLHEIRKFERMILASDAMFNYFVEIFIHFRIRTLKLFFEILSSDSNQRRELKKRLMDRIVEIPAILRYQRSRESLDTLVEFFHEVDQENKKDLICRWFDSLPMNASRYYDSLTIYDYLLLIAENLCDQEHMQIILKKIPSRDQFTVKDNDATEKCETDEVGDQVQNFFI